MAGNTREYNRVYWQTRRRPTQTRVGRLEAVVDAFRAYDGLLRAWGQRIDDGNQHVGDDPELDAAYAAILAALAALDAQSA